VGLVIEVTDYHALVIEPPPAPDETGMRGKQGVTGELKPRLVEIAQSNKTIKNALYGMTGQPTYDDVWNYVLLRYWVCHWFSETLNGCRIHYHDSNPRKEADWYRPFYHAMLVRAESQHRNEIGMPSAFTNDQFGMLPIMYTTFMNFVLDGSEYPDLAWREHYKEDIEAGRLRPPTF